MGHFEKNKLVFLSIFNKRPQFLIKKKVETKSFKNTIKIFVKIFRFPFNVCGIFEYQTILLGKKKSFRFCPENFNPNENFHENVCIGLKAGFLPLFSKNISNENISICYLISPSHLCKPNAIPFK